MARRIFIAELAAHESDDRILVPSVDKDAALEALRRWLENDLKDVDFTSARKLHKRLVSPLSQRVFGKELHEFNEACALDTREPNSETLLRVCKSWSKLAGRVMRIHESELAE